MIKQTFYNLPDYKRQRVINAVVDEFANAESDKVSINHIVQNAEISRGSFYQYFDDKLDLVEVLIKSFIDKGIDDVRRAIVSSDGDIFYTFECMYDVIIRFSEDEKQKRVLKNLISNVRANNNLVSDYIIKRYKGIDSLINITDEFSRKGFRFKSDEDMILLQQILTSVLKNAIYNYYVFDADAEETKKRYLRKLYIIKQGAMK
jgi:AcrR family transcriptional regulator